MRNRRDRYRAKGREGSVAKARVVNIRRISKTTCDVYDNHIVSKFSDLLEENENEAMDIFKNEEEIRI